MGIGSPVALLHARPMRWGWPREAAVGAVLLALALVLSTSMVGRELVNIQSLASDVQKIVLPQIMARQQRAIWTESLRSAANVVVYAPVRATRHEALAKAEQLAANVTHVDAASRRALDDAWASIRLAARKTDEAQRIEQQIRSMLSEADSLIGDMSANLGSIVDDSGATLARLIREMLSSHDRNRFSRQLLEEVLAINTTSNDLLASLDRGRIFLASALSMEGDDALSSAAAHFVAIGTQLSARVDTLRGNSDYEYLPDMIARFNRLDAVFELQRTRLALRREAMAASTSAKLRLSVVRENLAADAARAAESSVATIAASASRIRHTAAAMLIVLIIAAGIPIKRSWQAAKREREAALAAVEEEEATDQRSSPPERALSATVSSLEGLVKAQGNLEHWRQTLITKLTGAVASAMQQVGDRAVDPPSAADDHAAGPDGWPPGPDSALENPLVPPELEPPLTRAVELIEDIAARTSLTGLQAALDGVRVVRNTPLRSSGDADGAGSSAADQTISQDLAVPCRSLAAATAAADAVTRKVGATISAINAVTHHADEAWTLQQAASEIVRKVEALGDQLEAIRDLDWQRLGRSAGEGIAWRDEHAR